MDGADFFLRRWSIAGYATEPKGERCPAMRDRSDFGNQN